MLTLSFLLRPTALLLAVFILISCQLHASEEHSLESQLLQAAKNGDCAKVQSLLSAGANVNMADHNGWRPLYSACFEGHKI